MSRVLAVGVFIAAMAATLVIGHSMAHTSGVRNFMAPNPVVFPVAGGVTVALHTADLDTQHLRFEICGLDVTQIPARLPITMAFDAPINNIMVQQGDLQLVLEAQVAGQMTVVSLARDPFLPPGPWQVALQIAFETLPATGQITVGPSEVRAVHYQRAPQAPDGLARATEGCGELLAALGAGD